jgi:4-amino-4-deoxy-L-arabinose transferase-like glycosyltransferase
MTRLKTAAILFGFFVLAIFISIAFMAQMWGPTLLHPSRSEGYLILLNDARDYVVLGANLFANGVFSMSEHAPLLPDPLRTPAFPILIGMVWSLVGRSWPVVGVQIILLAGTAFLTFALASSLSLSRRAGLFAAALVLLEPHTEYIAAALMSETLYTFFFVAALFALAAIVRRREQRDSPWLAFGALLGLAILTRPNAMYFPLLAFPFLALSVRGSFPRRRFLACSLLSLAALSVVVSPWLFRNFRTFGTAGLSSAGPMNLYYLHTAPLVAARGMGEPLASLVDELRADGYPIPPEDPAREFPVFWLTASGGVMRVIFREALANPGYTARFLVRSVTDFVFVPSWRHLSESVYHFGVGHLLLARLAPFESAVNLLVAALALLGVAAVWRDRERRPVALLFLLTVIYIALTGVNTGATRTRVTAVPFAAILAATGAAFLASGARSLGRALLVRKAEARYHPPA